jgi:hypothetical protein
MTHGQYEYHERLIACIIASAKETHPSIMNTTAINLDSRTAV